MQPIIGVTTDLSDDEAVLQTNRTYTEALLHAGTIPLLLPMTTDAAVIDGFLHVVDGLLLTGGDDVDPACFGETQRWACGSVSPLRDGFELALCRRALEMRLPILGICRGCQVLNVALGGSLYQDLPSDLPGQTLAHRQKQLPRYTSHAVTVAEGSRLSDILGGREMQVNSHHHQAVKAAGKGLVVTTTAPDGVVEGIEHLELPFCIGVQWHPERLWNQPGLEAHARLFRAFAEACRKG